MMRTPTDPFPLPARRHPAVRAAMAPTLLALMLALSLQPVSAQTFSLPEPTPSATPAPQGPADERAGVRINPRIIRDSETTQTQTAPEPSAPGERSTPTAPPPEAPARSSANQPQPATPRSQAPAPNRSDAVTAQSDAPQSSQSTSQSTAPAQPETQSGPVINPGFDTEILPDRDAEPIGPDDWYDVTPDGETGSAPPARSESDQAPAASYSSDLQAVGAMALRNQIYIGLATMAVLALALAGLFWRRRRKEAALAQDDGTSLAFGVHRVIADEGPEAPGEEPPAPTDHLADSTPEDSNPATPEPVAPAPRRKTPTAPPSPADKSPDGSPANAPVTAHARTPEPLVDSEPPRIDVSLEIAGATRSVMMFTLDFSLEVANRSEAAVRELNISAQLATAQRGGSNAPPIAGGQPLAEIERLGPQQSRRIAGQLQLPLAEIKTIQQGSKPLFIPLLHVILEGKGQPVMNRSFVIGTPSSNSQTRVHPLTLDGPPGGLPRLRAQLIKQPIASGHQSAKAPERA